MRLFSMMRTALGGPAGLLPATVMATALIHPAVTQEVDLDDGGTRIANGTSRPTARLNRPAQIPDIRAGDARFDVDRSVGAVFVSFGVRPGRAASRRSRAAVRAGRRQSAARAARTRGEQR